MENRQEQKKEEKVRLDSRMIMVFTLFLGMVVGASLASFYYLANYSVPAYRCDLMALVPPGAGISQDLNLYVCYQEVNGIPGVVALCPTSVGMTFGLLPELNRDTVWQFYMSCRDLQARWSESEVNGQ